MGLSINDLGGLGSVANFATDLIDKIFPDKIAQAKEREEYLLKAKELDNQLAAGQLAINQAEASSDKLFVSGWRPFIGWVCGTAFTYHFVLQPVLAFGMASFGHEVKLPVFDMSTLSTVLLGMLGLGGLRTMEKIKGAS